MVYLVPNSFSWIFDILNFIAIFWGLYRGKHKNGHWILRASAEKFSRGRATEKRPKNTTFKPLPGARQPKKIAKKLKSNTIKPLSIISVPCMKIQGGGRHAPAADAHAEFIQIRKIEWCLIKEEILVGSRTMRTKSRWTFWIKILLKNY